MEVKVVLQTGNTTTFAAQWSLTSIAASSLDMLTLCVKSQQMFPSLARKASALASQNHEVMGDLQTL